MKWLSAALKIAGAAAMALTTAALYATLTHSWPQIIEYAPYLAPRGKMKFIGTQISKPAEFAVYGALGFWVMKKLVVLLKDRKPLLPPLKAAMMFLKQNHTFLGWLVFIVTISHGAFFLLNPEKEMKYTYTGLAAFAGLVAVVALGAVFSSKTAKKQPTPSLRKWHFTAAAAFLVLFLIHLYV